MKVLYTAVATADGGRAGGHARSSDGNLDVPISPPKELGGEGNGTNPEQLFAAGYAACFHSAVQIVARRMKQDASDSTVTAHVDFGTIGGGAFGLGVELHVDLPNVEPGPARRARREGARGVPVLERDARQHRGQAGGARGGVMFMLVDTRTPRPDEPSPDRRAAWEPNWRLWGWVALTIAALVAADVTSRRRRLRAHLRGAGVRVPGAVA